MLLGVAEHEDRDGVGLAAASAAAEEQVAVLRRQQHALLEGREGEGRLARAAAALMPPPPPARGRAARRDLDQLRVWSLGERAGDVDVDGRAGRRPAAVGRTLVAVAVPGLEQEDRRDRVLLVHGLVEQDPDELALLDALASW